VTFNGRKQKEIPIHWKYDKNNRTIHDFALGFFIAPVRPSPDAMMDFVLSRRVKAGEYRTLGKYASVTSAKKAAEESLAGPWPPKKPRKKKEVSST
jgi:hypothetical protein